MRVIISKIHTDVQINSKCVVTVAIAVVIQSHHVSEQKQSH